MQNVTLVYSDLLTVTLASLRATGIPSVCVVNLKVRRSYIVLDAQVNFIILKIIYGFLCGSKLSLIYF